ncbi:DNA-formamidopyrimidine glycosylase [Candidatus Woesebacteria bacterium RIFCSPHIGHO2_01_FULL_39_28]|uniref:DNA-formamidopyrimidine glycosylase n=1 Tax=Candidatus Woesebacteria bacterium RIFCSPHIGHO2_01_FULL_39_28 TaxID=1802496 RepID=A0A1F7YKF1_9BACT|nr:MAG: DNA-formamidopyrimidine glycosylase [Candidatus Woesebacteria bacterium RIFCSPHIGHO2_01_FULL_39_28]OGM57030.1 MAG: DNA-formamidopyrimidine glycosylase [Candidatus Woesebacteria bacterium RIFCSPLOWO2_01_FULL_38_20]
MPELPEVETIKLGLQKYLVSHVIEDVIINNQKIFGGDKKDLIGSKIKDVRRFAKVLSIDLSNGNSIIIHVKLTGQLIYRGPNLRGSLNLSKKVVGGVPGKHTHVIFKLDRGGTLYYNDVRRFGWIKIIKTSDVETSEFIGKLGPEPFGKLNKSLFKEIILKSKQPIKIVLMDQTKIGGIGNIYANDALWLSRIDPRKRSKELSDQEIKNLYEAVLEVLKEGIKRGGASELAFVTPDGSEGNYQKHFLAYGQEGKLCPRCKKAKFQKFFLGGRGTYWCPNCQK